MHETRRQVLAAIDDGPVAGPTVADELGVTRTAVWKHVETLRELGFDIEGGDDGYHLAGIPDFGGPAVEFGLDTDFEVEYHDSIDSTNARARDLAAEGATDAVVLADEQTGGRGRLDREWSSPSGGVWLSVLTRPDLPPTQVPVYTLAAAVAVTRAAREAGVEAVIKWPNDVLVDTDGGERKLSGILTEMEGEADRVSWVVVGVGTNVNVEAAALPPTATSIAEQVGPVDRRAFTQRLLETFDECRRDPRGVVDAWREYAVTLGERVRVETPVETVEGEAVDVHFPGSLVVETDAGRRTVTAGDCEHLRRR